MSFDLEEEIKRFESVNSVDSYEKDTAMAVLMIEKNKAFINSRISKSLIQYKYIDAEKLILESYPHADRNVIKKALFKINVYTCKTIFFYFLTLLVFVDIGMVSGIFYLADKPIDQFFFSALYLGVSTMLFLFTMEKIWDNL